MKTIYADSTAVLRVVLVQTGERVPIGRASVLIASELVEVETQRALDRAHAKGLLDASEFARKTQELAALLATFHLFPLDREMIELAGANFPADVSTLQALHVGTAQVVAREAGAVEFWTHSGEQAAAAAVRGFKVRGLKNLA